MIVTYSLRKAVNILAFLIAGVGVIGSSYAIYKNKTKIQQDKITTQEKDIASNHKSSTESIVREKQENESKKGLNINAASRDSALRSEAAASTSATRNTEYKDKYVIDGEDDYVDVEQRIIDAEVEAEQSALERVEYLSGIEEQHATQKVDVHWAASLERSIWESYRESGLNQTIDLHSIDCRTDSCILNIEPITSVHEVDSGQEQGFIGWVSANAGSCEFAIKEEMRGEDPVSGAKQTVYLTRCR